MKRTGSSSSCKNLCRYGCSKHKTIILGRIIGVLNVDNVHKEIVILLIINFLFDITARMVLIPIIYSKNKGFCACQPFIFMYFLTQDETFMCLSVCVQEK